jgi:hypothetical protein
LGRALSAAGVIDSPSTPATSFGNCRGCSVGGRDAISLVMHIDGVGFRQAMETLSDGAWRPPTRRRYPEISGSQSVRQQPRGADDEERMTVVALDLWAAGVNPRGTLVQVYLASRCLELGEDTAGEVIRWHGGIGAMLALFRDIQTDEPRAVSRTYLDKDTQKIERKFLGPVGGCAIKLDADGAVLGGLLIAEGVESAMAARQLDLRPTWALGSKGAIGAFPVLEGVECLTILGEADAEREIHLCAAR